MGKQKGGNKTAKGGNYFLAILPACRYNNSDPPMQVSTANNRKMQKTGTIRAGAVIMDQKITICLQLAKRPKMVRKNADVK